ncbi:GntR family transcriptional regulator [Cohaesibacter gelatinilyticus]|uniref:Transcriptional regulator, GntR family n=1 Tax=Cohaesibacter gelatinilyticus TaxID=372072 RepID=A0A285PGH7_9HYPH|nr:GntR family transcriptional regulator [Cohaesibacter gelatinilyticus]SNZ19246.1 transcriptional regulator, GntR family [Cohaesibacter gelatinilyticus]
MALERPKSLRELALEYLRGRIVDGTFQMGQVLSERKISEELGVSKSPVREALAQLRDEGLVHIEPQKGARVFTLSEDEVIQICDFRQAIESASFELALQRDPKGLAAEMDRVVQKMVARKNEDDEDAYIALDNDFHQVIFEHAGNDYLTASYTRYVGKIAALRKLLSQLPKHTDLSFDEHKAIAEAVRKGNLVEIKALLAEHIDRTRTAYTQATNFLKMSVE